MWPLISTEHDRCFRSIVTERIGIVTDAKPGDVARGWIVPAKVGVRSQSTAPNLAISRKLQLVTSKGIIASRLNLTQEHFSRILRELSDTGLIAVRGREIIVLDVARLRGGAAA